MRRILLLLVSLLLIASACGNDETDGQAAPETNGEAPQVVESTDDTLPATFPDDLPLPQPHRVLYSVAHDQAQVVFFDADLEYAQLREFMAAELPRHGWVLQVCQEADMGDEPTTVVMAVKTNRMATIMIGYVELPQAQFQGRYSFNVAIAEMPEVQPAPEEPVTC